MTKILLTGATGFLGSHLLRSLLANNYEVVILKRSFSDISRINREIEQVKSYDIDKVTIDSAFINEEIDIVIHTSCHYGRNGSNLLDVIDTNLIFSIKLLKACLQNNVRTFFNTDTHLDKNLNPYSLSKGQFLDWLKFHNHSINIVNLKVEHMYGPGDDEKKFVPWILSQFQCNKSDIKLTEGTQKRDFIYIDDVVSAYLLLLEKCEKFSNFEQFDVGSGFSIKIRDLIQKLKDKYEEEFLPVQSNLNFGAIPMREGEKEQIELDNSRLVDLGWTVRTDLDKGITKIIRELKES